MTCGPGRTSVPDGAPRSGARARPSTSGTPGPLRGRPRSGRPPRCSRPCTARGPGPGPRRAAGAGCGRSSRLLLGVEPQEALADDVLVVEQPAAELVLGPGDAGEVRVRAVPAGEDLVPDAERVEEVDRVAARHPVPGRALVDLHAVEGEDVGGLADLVPVVEPEGEVVQRAVRPVDDGDVVRGVAAFQPDAELVAVGVQDLLGHAEAECFLEEGRGLADLLGVDQHVIEPRWRDPGHAGRRHRRRVQLAQQAAGLVQLVDQFHGLPGRDAEPDRLALADGLSAADPLHLAAVPGYGVLQLGQVVLALDPEAEQVEPGPRVVAKPDRVVVLLVPALEVDGVLAALG